VTLVTLDDTRLRLVAARLNAKQKELALFEASMPAVGADVRRIREELDALDAEQRAIAEKKLALQRQGANAQNALQDHRLKLSRLREEVATLQEELRKDAVPLAARPSPFKRQFDGGRSRR
jgi:chromosome segregation ATPase